MKVRILGKMWKIIRKRSVRDSCGNVVRGTCDPPCAKGKSIVIDDRLHGEEELEVTIHELIHAANWQLFSEEFVAELSVDMARVLTRLGWTKTGE